jgi:hypothetical protein
MRVGVTGHRELANPDAWAWVERVLRDELAALPPPLMGVTSLAVGADQLFARQVLQAGGAIHAVLPFDGLERSMPPAAVAGYRELLARASVEVLEPMREDDDAYLEAGHRVVNQSELMVAIWNGEPARGKGGTAEVVHYARRSGVALIHLDPVRLVVLR